MCGPGRALLTASRFTAPRDEHAAPCLRGGAKVGDYGKNRKGKSKNESSPGIHFVKMNEKMNFSLYATLTFSRFKSFNLIVKASSDTSNILAIFPTTLL